MKMYFSFIFLTSAILLNGCGNTNQFEEKSLKEVLNSHIWYEIDESKDLYAVHRFSNKEYQKTRYSSSNFASSIDKISGDIISYNSDTVTISIDGNNYTCDICGDEKSGYEILACNAPDDVLPSCSTIWTTKSQALANKPQ